MCDTSSCCHNYLGCFGTLEEAAQAYLQHQQHSHSSHLPATDTWFQCDDCNKRCRFAAAAAHTMPDPSEEEHWCCKDSGGSYTCAQEEEGGVKHGGGKKGKHQSIENQVAASTSLAGSEKLKNEHPEQLKKERAPPLQVQADDKKRKLQSMAEPSVLHDVQEHLLIRSDKGKTGYKGVVANHSRYSAKCNTPPCHSNRLGTFDTPGADNGRCYANCDTSPCHGNRLGTFDTPEDAAQSYLQHQQKEHEHAAELNDMKPLAEEEEEEGHAVSTDKGKKRKEQPQHMPEIERLRPAAR